MSDRHRLPTEAEVAEMCKFLDENTGAPEVSMSTGEFRRLLALVEAWAPIVRGAAGAYRFDECVPKYPAIRDEWKRWKGEVAP